MILLVHPAAEVASWHPAQSAFCKYASVSQTLLTEHYKGVRARLGEGPKVLLLGGNNPKYVGGAGMQGREGYYANTFIMLNNDYPFGSVLPREPALLADFNDIKKFTELAQIFKGCFSVIAFDWSVSKFIENHEALIPLLAHMLKPDGKFICEYENERRPVIVNASQLELEIEGCLKKLTDEGCKFYRPFTPVFLPISPCSAQDATRIKTLNERIFDTNVAFLSQFLMMYSMKALIYIPATLGQLIQKIRILIVLIVCLYARIQRHDKTI